MKHETSAQRECRLRQVYENNSVRAESYANVCAFPANQAANIEKWKQKIAEIKNDPYLAQAEKKQQIERCKEKIADIQKSIERFYVQHPYIKREVLEK